jgi:hypothetical protein
MVAGELGIHPAAAPGQHHNRSYTFDYTKSTNVSTVAEGSGQSATATTTLDNTAAGASTIWWNGSSNTGNYSSHQTATSSSTFGLDSPQPSNVQREDAALMDEARGKNLHRLGFYDLNADDSGLVNHHGGGTKSFGSQDEADPAGDGGGGSGQEGNGGASAGTGTSPGGSSGGGTHAKEVLVVAAEGSDHGAVCSCGEIGDPGLLAIMLETLTGLTYQAPKSPTQYQPLDVKELNKAGTLGADDLVFVFDYGKTIGGKNSIEFLIQGQKDYHGERNVSKFATIHQTPIGSIEDLVNALKEYYTRNPGKKWKRIVLISHGGREDRVPLPPAGIVIKQADKSKTKERFDANSLNNLVKDNPALFKELKEHLQRMLDPKNGALALFGCQYEQPGDSAWRNSLIQIATILGVRVSAWNVKTGLSGAYGIAPAKVTPKSSGLFEEGARPDPERIDTWPLPPKYNTVVPNEDKIRTILSIFGLFPIAR